MKTECAQLERELERNLADRFWRLNNLYWIMDEQGNKVKYHLNRVQYLLYTLMWYLNIILKSRQHGITTFICIFFLDACLFNNDVRCGIIAHKLEDAKKIFRDKIKYAYERMVEEYPELAPDCQLIKDDSLEILFANNSGIYVGTSMRSGTLQYLHVSEYGWLCAHAPIKAAEIKAGALETVHEEGIIFIESTAEGVNDDFQLMCETAMKKAGRALTRLDYRFHFFPWYLKEENQIDPAGVIISTAMGEYFERIEKENKITIPASYRAWYVKKKETLGRKMFRQHPTTPKEAFLATIQGAYYSERMGEIRELGRISKCSLDLNQLVYVVIDPGFTSAMWLFQPRGTDVRFIRYYEDSGTGIDGFGKLLLEWGEKYHYRYGTVFVPCDMDSNAQRVVHGDTSLEVLRELEFKVEPLPREKSVVHEGIPRTRRFLSRCWFDEENCRRGIECLERYHEQINHAVSTEEVIIYTGVPDKTDGYDHGADAMRYASMVFEKDLLHRKQASSLTKEELRKLKEKYRRNP